jgi:hypothetical protein
MILTIGEGKEDHYDLDYIIDEENKMKQLYGLLSIPYYLFTSNDEFTSEDLGIQASLSWLYPNGFESVLSSTILAATNVQIDRWNQIVQEMNVLPLQTLTSKDTFADVDDPKGHLKVMLTTNVLNEFESHNSSTSCPPVESQ